ncbi:MAG: isoamylase early set domain-containing protein, partial [bacterium]
RRPRRGRGWLTAAATIAHRPAWAAALAAGIVAIATAGILRARPSGEHVVVSGSVEPVTFVFVAPDAKSVQVVGDFNNWGLDDSGLPARNLQGVWSVTARIPAGVHRYAFVVNGKTWVADPTAPRSSGDDFGKPSSALVVEDSTK